MTNRNRPFILVSAVAATGLSLVAAGCGGASSPGVAASAGTTTVAYGTSGAVAAALTFARCMRAHGVPMPDPRSDGSFDKRKLVSLGIPPSRVRSVEDQYCHVDFENPGETQTVTAAERLDYLKAAACMRRHGYPNFPDPTFPDNSVRVDIPASIDQNSSRFRNAATICTKLIPRGLPYTRLPGQ